METGPDSADYVREPDTRVNSGCNPQIHHTAAEDQEDEPL